MEEKGRGGGGGDGGRDWEVSAEDREERVFSPAMGRFEDGDEGEKSGEERHDGRREGQKEVGWWLRRVEG